MKQSNNPAFADSVIAECPKLKTLPDHNLSMSSVERLWAADRVAYVDCASGKAELVRTLRERGMIEDGKI